MDRRESDADTGTPDALERGELSRRTFLKYLVAAAVLPALPVGSLLSRASASEIENAAHLGPSRPPAPQSIQAASVQSAPGTEVLVSHEEFLAGIQSSVERADLSSFLLDFKGMMLRTTIDCVLNRGNWMIPSRAYGEYFYVRDSYWLLSALRDRKLSSLAVGKFAKDQQAGSDGQVTTALVRSGARPDYVRRRDDSTMMYVLHCYLLSTLDGQPSESSLQRARDYILSQVKKGKYVTRGETRTGLQFGGDNELGTFHYWADTYRPNGEPKPTPQVFAYNQGLLCVALRCLDEMGISVKKALRRQAEDAYATMVNPRDHRSLPQRDGSDVVDVSALVGEALSLYLFDEPLLTRPRVAATLNRLARVDYPDGSFLGFKVISSYDGGYRPLGEFAAAPLNRPGRYQNGASWLLYDALALYAGARHHVAGRQDMFVERLTSEVRKTWASHEFIYTDPESLGESDTIRDGYGWNAFVLNLLP